MVFFSDRGLFMSAFVTGVSTMTLWASLSAGVFAATPSAFELHPSTAVPGATVSIGGKRFPAFQSVQVNRVTVGGFPALIQRWESDLIEVKVPFQAQSGPVEIMAGKKKMAAGTLTVVQPTITAVTPAEIEPGHTVQIAGVHFGVTAGPRDPNTMFGVNDVMIGGVVVRPRRWKDDIIEVEVPANAASGDVVVRLASSDPLPDGSCCAPVQHKLSNAVPLKLIPSIRVDPIGTLLRISGEHFGFYSESGATPYAFTDFNTGENRVDIGGVRAVIYRWQDDRIDVWVPFSAKSGPVVMYRGATKPNSDGSCCATKEILKTEAGVFTLVTPKVDSYSPQSGGLDELITIKGSGFGTFLKTAEHADLGLNQGAYKRR